MGAVAQNHADSAGDKGILPARFTAEPGIISVALDIGLIQNIDTVFIAKVIPAVVILVVLMACSYTALTMRQVLLK